MLSNYIFLLALPVVAYCRIDIGVRVSSLPDDISVDFRGEDIALISEQERRTFGLNDGPLKDASVSVMGRRCTDLYLREPTPWQAYPKHGWSEVRRILKPIRARVIAVNSKPVAVATSEYVNRSKMTATYSSGLTQTVDDTVSTSWTKGGELSVGQEINYNVNIGAGSIGGTTSFNYAANWGQGSTKENKISLGSVSNVQIDIPPRRRALAKLMATRGSIDVEVEYQATLDGDVFCNFYPKFDGHFFYAIGIDSFIRGAGLRSSITSKEVISINFYTGFRTEVVDLKNL